MRKLNVAFCDSDETYCSRFVTYLMEHKAKEMSVHAFFEPEIFMEQLGEKVYDAVFAGGGFYQLREQLQTLKIPVLWLTEERTGDTEQEEQKADTERSVFKYQPVEVILHEMQVLSAGVQRRLPEGMMAVRKLEVIGVCSPIGHEMQLPFSVVAAMMLASKRKVLYLNFTEYSGFPEVFLKQVEYDMGDVMVPLRNHRLTPEIFMRSVYELEQISFIAPFHNPVQLLEITAEDMAELLLFIEQKTVFETLIIDCGGAMPVLLELLERCSSIYCIGRTGYFYECRQNQFVRQVQMAEKDILSERLQQVELPFSAKGIQNSGNVIEQLLWSDFGDYVRSYLSGGGV